MIVTTLDQLDELVEIYSGFDAFAYDVETRGPHRGQPRRNDVFWISFAGPGRGDVIPMGHPLGSVITPAQKIKLPEADCPDPKNCARCSQGQRTKKDGTISRAQVVHNISATFSAPPPQLDQTVVFGALRPLLFSGREKGGQGLKFDVQSLAKYYDGVMPPGPYFDTLQAAKLLDENFKAYKLGDQVERAFQYRYDKSLGKIGVDTFSFEDAALYAYLDAKYTWLLMRLYRDKLSLEGLSELFHDVEMPILGVVCGMELSGAPVDAEGFQKLHDELDFRCRQLEKKIEEANGGPINLNADRQVADLVYGKRGYKPTIFTDKTNEPSTSKKALEGYAYKNPRLQPDPTIDSNIKDPIVAAILEHAQTYKILSTYMANNLEAATEEGRLYGQFDQLGTKTGRFSSYSPNLQNIPIRQGKQVRDLFIAPPGYKLIVADYSQVELRILAHYTQDPMLLKAYREGLDLHEMTARAAYSIPEDQEVPSKQRSLAKNVNFSVIYMGTAWTIVNRYEVPEKEAQIVVDGFYKIYKNVKPWQQSVIQECRKNYRKKGPGQRYVAPHVRTVLGRKRRLPEIFWEDQRKRAERQAVNAKIQGTAADIAKLAMIRLDQEIKARELDMQLIMVVHDEFVVMVPDDKVDEGVALVKDSMEGVNMLTVPLEVDVKLVDRWSEGK
jgi:DNA polymerase I-like protein with 3'-5' exonuclease and polymerase domains